MGLALFVATVTMSDSMVPVVAATSEVATTTQTIVAVETEAEQAKAKTNNQLLTTEAQVKAYFADTPILAEVAFCESRFRQFDENGNVLRGVQNNQDVGVMQINEKYHLETAQKLGLNLYTLEGNMAYGKYLYDTQGTKPWNYSSHCWGKHREVAVR
ncbi:MAG: hypothetical protein KA802_18410 [Saprospiraceae bacterium]|jgi:hypothetical protein|nr:hypothetical protein [Saprospiraceae bacterium]